MSDMNIQDFEKIKNRQRPDLMFQYKLVKYGYKFEITTMDSGQSYSASIESYALNGKTYLSDLWKEGLKTVDDCLREFETFRETKKPVQ